MKILLAEDEPDLQFIIGMALEGADYTVVTASNGLEALRLLERDSFDLLLVDVMMPQMSGLELCQHLRHHPVWQHIPIILLTASPSLGSLLKDLPPSVCGWIEKPFDVFDLVDRIKSIFPDHQT
ncbi:MAG: response regulator [Chloroflexus sp.]|jgi:CheY-like chemotaxis protein|nr:response regulator [Chloroflexus sp.]MBO9315829.1 response regulator [Chloroflexus sp.]MBO9317559.1 response regulator [Chloroflexus sp.]MBO9339459.1 response regulator [Chloroflexus sp.]MBO9373909.1 response regulator [Chloroflexus sp.]